MLRKSVVSPVFDKCGPKEVLKCYENNDYFNSKLLQYKDAKERYALNKLLIDFTEIPSNIVDDFKKNVLLYK